MVSGIINWFLAVFFSFRRISITENLKRQPMEFANGHHSDLNSGNHSLLNDKFPGGRDDMFLGEAGFIKKPVRSKTFESLFLFVTSQCNSRCRTCFYSSKINEGKDLTFQEIQKLSLTAPEFDKLWISGGEPFLRKDLAEIIELFYVNNRIRTVNLPTNGILKDSIDVTVRRLLKSCPDLDIHLNFSIDGFEETHDQVRGIPGSFQKVICTMEKIEKLYGDNKRLYINVATVITPDVMNEAADLGQYLFNRFNLATHFFETLRGNPRDPSIKCLGREQIARVHDQVLPLYELMADRLFGKFPFLLKGIARMFFIGTIHFMYRLQEKNVDKPCPWGMNCTAGKTTLVVDHDGAFRSCELRDPVGFIQDHDCNFASVYNSVEMKREIDAVGGGKKANCWCTHGCWMIASMKFSPRTLLVRIPVMYFRYLRHKHQFPAVTESSIPELKEASMVP